MTLSKQELAEKLRSLFYDDCNSTMEDLAQLAIDMLTSDPPPDACEFSKQAQERTLEDINGFKQNDHTTLLDVTSKTIWDEAQGMFVPFLEEAKRQNLFAKSAQPRLPQDHTARKNLPVMAFLDYFPEAVLEIVKVMVAGNDQHNPGEPLHWARGKSMDHDHCIIRHMMDRGTVDKDGLRHTAKAAIRTLMLLQLEMEEALGLPPSRGSR